MLIRKEELKGFKPYKIEIVIQDEVDEGTIYSIAVKLKSIAQDNSSMENIARRIMDLTKKERR